MGRGQTKIELFEELAGIDENGCSRWVYVTEFVGKYQGLQLLNGAGWSRDDGTFGKNIALNATNPLLPVIKRTPLEPLVSIMEIIHNIYGRI